MVLEIGIGWVIIFLVACALVFFLIGYWTGHHKGVACGRRKEEEDHVNKDF
jgi:uncharacterized membrane protein YedE/YeeE